MAALPCVSPCADAPQQGAPPTLSDTDVERLADLLIASRVLVDQEVLDSFGNISVHSAKIPGKKRHGALTEDSYDSPLNSRPRINRIQKHEPWR